MDMASKDLPMVIIIRVNIIMEDSMEKENMYGPIVPAIKEILLMGQGMVMANGIRQNKMEIYMLVNIISIRKMVMGSIYGQMDVFIKDTSRMI